MKGRHQKNATTNKNGSHERVEPIGRLEPELVEGNDCQLRRQQAHVDYTKRHSQTAKASSPPEDRVSLKSSHDSAKTNKVFAARTRVVVLAKASECTKSDN